MKIIERTVSSDRKGSISRVLLPKGKCQEIYYEDHTTILSRKEEFVNFAQQPYCVWPSGDHLLLFTPKWTEFRAGWLVKETQAYNVYRVDISARWANLIPEEFLKQLEADYPEFLKRLEPKFKSLKVLDSILSGESEELDKAWKHYRPYFTRREEGGIRVKPGQRFSLICELVKDGILPFIPKQVEFRNQWRTDITPRDYQQEALEFLRQYGNAVVLWPPGTGKTICGILVMAAISGPTLIVCPTLSLVGQWEKMLKEHLVRDYGKPRIGVYAENRRELGDIIVTTYQSAPKLKDRKYDLIIADETQHLPADTFSRLATFDTKYRLGLTATAIREDGRSYLIFALFGFPHGQRWELFFERRIVKKPIVRVVTTHYKLSSLKRILESSTGRTLIFCDSIDLGNKLSREIGYPFIYGEHSSKERMSIVGQHEKVICSRVFDEGMDLPDIKTVVEADFLYGSRRQELQRLGRLLHSKYSDIKHFILMTPEELAKYGKRLYSLYEREFEVRFEAG